MNINGKKITHKLFVANIMYKTPVHNASSMPMISKKRKQLAGIIRMEKARIILTPQRAIHS
jgi:hypothetical protein